MQPPLPAAPVFEETQWFRHSWRWLWLGLSLLILAPIGAALLSDDPDGPKAALLTAPLWLGALAGLWWMRLKVRVDSVGVHYQFPPLLNRWRHWPWAEFKHVTPRTYAPFRDYGGWGIKGSPGDLLYNVRGSAGLQLVFQSGDRLLLGTQRPEELRATLEALLAADASRPIQPAAADLSVAT